jgi:hypothetical protein
MIRNTYDLQVMYFMLTKRDKVESSTDLHSIRMTMVNYILIAFLSALLIYDSPT